MTLDQYCLKWKLSDPTMIASTFTSKVYRVKAHEKNVVLKIFNQKGKQSESQGSVVLRYFDGNGAVQLINADEGAHLLEFSDGRPLKEFVIKGDDAAATDIICEVLNKLHMLRGPIPSKLISMERNFRCLFNKVKTESSDSLYASGARLAERLIGTEQEVRVLHGDIHHENILESSERGWLAIDPKCLKGERTYDVANTFYNPSGFGSLIETTETIERRCAAYSKYLHLDHRRILEFAFAYGCLSAAWSLEDGLSAETTLRIARRIQQVMSENL